MQPQFYLASGSPRRAELLQSAGLCFLRLIASVPEIPAPGQKPLEYAIATARAKARAGRQMAPSALPVLAADTDVSIDGAILGKPVDRADAVGMLLRLSGRAHDVCSAVALEAGGRLALSTTVTRVVFGEISPAQAAAYWETGEPCDKAGAYAIQGFAACWVRAIEGSYTGVVGLPLYETLGLLAAEGIRPGAFVDGSAGVPA